MHFLVQKSSAFLMQNIQLPLTTYGLRAARPSITTDGARDPAHVASPSGITGYSDYWIQLGRAEKPKHSLCRGRQNPFESVQIASKYAHKPSGRYLKARRGWIHGDGLEILQ